MSKALRAGTQTGSLINHLMSGSAMPEPEVGMGVTILCWTDRKPATIVEVIKTKAGKVKAIAIQADNYESISGSVFEETVEYKYAPNPDAVKEIYTLRGNGAWAKPGSPARNHLLIGQREKYYDPHF